jgi:hypothetical protein
LINEVGKIKKLLLPSLLIVLVVGVSLKLGIYYFMSPYQECMGDDITQKLVQVQSSATNKTPEEADVFLKDICKHWAKETRWDWVKEIWNEPSEPIRP